MGERSTKRISSSKSLELPEIDQRPKERIHLLSLLKNMKWNKIDRSQNPDYDKTPEVNEYQILSAKKNHAAVVKELLRNHKNSTEIKREANESMENELKVPKTPSEKLIKRPMQLPPLTIVGKNENSKIKRPTKVQFQSRELIETQNQIAKVKAELEFLTNNPDYIPETSEIKGNLIKNASKVLKKHEPKLIKKNDPKLLSEISKSRQVTKIPQRKLSRIPKLNLASGEDLYKEFADNPRTKKDIEKLRETENKIAEIKAKLALLKKSSGSILQEKECVKVEKRLIEQPDSKVVVEYKNKIADLKAELVFLQDNQEESFEDYAKRMQTSYRWKRVRTLDTIAEEEIVEESCEEDAIENPNKELNEEEIDEEAGDEKTDREEETKKINEEDDENTEIEETKNKRTTQENNKLDAQKKRNLIKILQKMKWINSTDADEPNESEEVELAESSDNEEVEEPQLEESTDDEEVVESLQFVPVKIDDAEIKPFNTKKTDIVSPKTSKIDIFASFFKSKYLQKDLVSKLKSELLDSCPVASPKIRETSTSENDSENSSLKSQASDDDSLSSFFDEKPLRDPDEIEKQNKLTETLSDYCKSGSETKDMQRLLNSIKCNLEQDDSEEAASKNGYSNFE